MIGNAPAHRRMNHKDVPIAPDALPETPAPLAVSEKVAAKVLGLSSRTLHRAKAPSPRALHPTGIYSKERLAAILDVSTKTIERMASIDVAAMEAKAVKGDGTYGELPPPFYLGRKPYWMGRHLIEHFERRQQNVLKQTGALS